KAIGSYILRENSHPALRVVPSPHEETTAVKATATHTVPRKFLLFITNIFSFIVLNFYCTCFFQKIIDQSMICIFTGINSDNKTIVTCSKIHYTGCTSREKVIAEKECRHHT